MIARALAAVALAAAAAVAVPTNALALPCGLLETVDRLLQCDDGTAPAGSTGASTASAPELVGATEPGASWGSGTARVDPNRLLVRFRAGTSRAAAAVAARDAGGTLERRLAPLGLDVVRADADRLSSVRAELERTAIVRAVFSEQLVGVTAVQPNDAHWPSQTGLHVARFADAWPSTTGSPATVVAVIDTGVASTHPDLAGALLPGVDVLNGDGDASDDHGHGTAVAGIVAARGNNGAGIAGVCWLCRIAPIKALGADGTGPTSAIAAGILWATDHGAHVINLSLGSPQTTPALAAAVAYATSRGVLVVAAAGNRGVADPFYPAAEEGAIAIGATDDRDRAYSWSNHGPWVELAAPGCLPTTLRNGGYGVECGTSVAAPVVAGLGALALSVRSGITAAAVADALARSALPVGSFVRNGRIDAARTIAALAASTEVQSTVTVRSSLTSRRPMRAFDVHGGGGTWTVAARFDRRRRLTVAVVDSAGTVVARTGGRSPLHLAKRLPSGRYRVRVAGMRGAFRLAITRPAPSSADARAVEVYEPRAVRLSTIPPIQGEPARGASLGRPPLKLDEASALGIPRITNPEPIERRIAAAINRLRRSRGLHALSPSAPLARAGDAHARSLAVAGAFTHDWPLSPPTSFARWIVRYYGALPERPWRAGENLLWAEGAVTPEQAVTMWMNSPSHRAIMVGEDWRELGIGVVRAEGAGGVFAGRDVYLVAAEFGAR